LIAELRGVIADLRADRLHGVNRRNGWRCPLWADNGNAPLPAALVRRGGTDSKLDRRCFIVRGASRQALAYVYFEEEAGRRSAAHSLIRDEARRIAANIAKLRELLRKPGALRPTSAMTSTSDISLHCAH
jgi:hypothetical protein